MNIIKALCYQVYEWNKRDFWLIASLSILSAITFHSIEVPALLQGIIIFVLSFKVIFFIKSASIMASHGVEGSQFSWKYLQSLPISKYELIAFLLISNLFVMSPGIIWFMSFQNILIVELFDVKDHTLFDAIKILFYIFPGLMLITNASLKAQIQAPRKQFARKHDRKLFLQTLRNIIVFLCLGLYFCLGVILIEETLKIEIFKTIGLVFQTIESLFDSPLSPLLVFLLLMFSIRYTIRIWQREELSYSKLSWKPRRDIPITVLAFAMLYVPISNLSDTPAYYQTDPILTEIYDRNEEAVKALLSKGANPNLVNKFGMTPAIAAAARGRLSTLKLLEEHGAKHDGVLKLGKSHKLTGAGIFLAAIESENYETASYLLKNGYSANTKNEMQKYYAIHLAKSTFTIKILLENGADINATNGNGETAMHIAAKRNQNASILALQEAGLNPFIKDKNGITAIKYTNDPGLRYFLETKFRAPASVK
jgi:ankyrin repeat protein